MNGSQFARSENNRRSTQIAYDNREPDSEPSEDEALRIWLSECPAELTSFQEADILRIAGRGW